MPRLHTTQLQNVAPLPIIMTDETPTPAHFNENSHITDVLVGDHHEINGDTGSLYVVWSVRIIINEATYSLILLYKRYSEIEKFRADLVRAFPLESVPPLPAKDSFKMQRLVLLESWLETRRKGLQWFLSNVLLDPKFMHCQVITDFVLS